MKSESVFVILFFAGFVIFTIGESLWLSRIKGVNGRKAVALSALSNSLCITLGFFVSFIIFEIIFAMAWDGSLQNVSGGDVSIWAAVIAGCLAPYVLLLLTKRLLVKVLAIDSIARPFGYAALASLLFLVAVLAPPSIFTYFFMK